MTDPSISKTDSTAPDLSAVDLRETATTVFYWALAVGISLVVVSIFADKFQLTIFEARIAMLCAGLGIIFFAFGTRASLRLSTFVMGGSGAIAVFLFWGIMNYVKNEFVQVEIASKTPWLAQISVGAAKSFLGRQDSGYYHFIALHGEMDRDYFDVNVSVPASKDGARREEEHIFSCIPSEALAKYIGGGKTLDWRLNDDFTRLTMTASGNEYRDDVSACSGKSAVKVGSGFSLIASAWGQAALNFDDVFHALKSDFVQTRRDARSKLSDAGINMVQPMLKLMRSDDDYRIQLGGLVALSGFLRVSKPQAGQVAAKMSAEDFSLLVDQVANDDKTLRIYANEFAYDLASPRILAPAKEKLDTLLPSAQSKADAAYSLIAVMGSAYVRADADEMRSTGDYLKSLKGKIGSNTDILIDKILQNAQ